MSINNSNSEGNPGFFSNFKFDLASGLVVFFVALPLCLGISLASTSYSDIDGIEDFAGIVMPGLISGIIGGILVGTFSGSKYGVSGPAAGLITIVTAAIIEFGGFENGGFEKFILAVMLGGVIQFVFGLIKAGVVAYYIPFSVIKGMLAGIGITIFIKELPHFFGHDDKVKGDLDFEGEMESSFSNMYGILDDIHIGATIVAIISLIILVVWGMKFIKNNKTLNLIPGPLLAILVSVGVAAILAAFPNLLIEGKHLVNVPTPENLSEFKGMFYTPDFGAIGDPAVWRVALVIALVASIESLLCVEATDKMDPDKGRTPMNRELRAQGIGNVASGLLGGLPITQVIVRSTANLNSGAKSKWSAVIHGVFLLVFIIAIPGVLNMIPRATLAAVLLLIGWKLASPNSMIAMLKSGWTNFVPFAVVITVMLVPGGDLLKGVGAGIAVAAIILLYKNASVSSFVKKNSDEDFASTSIAKSFEDKAEVNGDQITLVLTAHANFLNKANVMKTLDNIEDNKNVVLDLSRTVDIDYDIAEAIKDFRTSATDRNIELTIIHEEKLG
jgi:MFS superfamily sulfate permease-like transporter